MEKRYIKLESEDIAFLKVQKKTSKSERVRDRSQALLLSNKGYDIKSLIAIFEVRRATILDWFNRWESENKSGLVDKFKSGRPRRFTDEEEKK